MSRIILLLTICLMSCEKPSLEEAIPVDAILFSEVVYTKGWAEVGKVDKVRIYTNGEEFITERRADGSRLRVFPIDAEGEGAYVQSTHMGNLLTREQCTFHTPKVLTSEYFVL